MSVEEIKDIADDGVVELLRGWLEMAEKGDIQAVAMVALRSSGATRTGTAGYGGPRGDLLFLGSLEILKFDLQVEGQREYIISED